MTPPFAPPSSSCTPFCLQEKLTLPNMEDLVVPVLNSGLPEDTQKPLS